MKKIVLLAVMGLVLNTIHAQSLDDVKEALGETVVNYTKAKELVDKHLANPKYAAKAEGWYYKGYIYNAISKTKDLNSLCANCKMEAFEAFKKYQELDKKNVLMALRFNDQLFDLYNGLYDEGSAAFKAEDYKTAMENYKNALVVEDYVRSKDFDYNGYKFPAIDTSVIINVALSARLDKNYEEAIKYYKQLTEANVAGTANLEMYQFIATYYKDKKDAANFSAALAQGRKLYPDEPFWTALEMESIDDGGTKDEVFAKYDEMAQKNPTDYTIAYKYAAMLYNYLYIGEGVTDAKKKEAYKMKLGETAKKAIALQSNAESNLLMARYLYNSAYDYSDDANKITGGKPDEIKRRKELNDKSISIMNECIPYCEAANKYYVAMPSLKPIDKANYKLSLGMLQNMYQAKKDKVKADAYGKQIESL